MSEKRPCYLFRRGLEFLIVHSSSAATSASVGAIRPTGELADSTPRVGLNGGGVGAPPDARGNRELSEPPTNDDGTLICGRERVRTSDPCGSNVGIPWTPCDRHQPLDPIVWVSVSAVYHARSDE